MSNTAALRVLTIPGYTNSGPQHWMTLWEQQEPAWRRVEQRDWDSPVREEWVSTLVSSLQGRDAPRALLIAHSLGCLTVVHAAAQAGARIAGAFLVAPADVEQAAGIEELSGFGPVPMARLPFPTCVVASTDDPYLRPERAVDFSRAWGAELHMVGSVGHINTASGLGQWPSGKELWGDFSRRLGSH